MPVVAEPETAQEWRAQPRQAVFLRREEFEILYGGAAGGGKTDALLIYNIMRRVEHPGTAGLFLRRSFADLSRAGAAIDRSAELLQGTGAAWHATDHKWRFPNGSVFEFGYLAKEDDKYHYQGSQYEDIQFDQLEQFTEAQYLYLFSRARVRQPNVRATVRASANPGGTGHGWVKKRFIDPLPPEEVGWFKRVNDQDSRVEQDDPLGRDRLFIPATVYDNPALLDRNPDYISSLMALPEMERRALLEGDWYVFMGQMFTEWSPPVHVVEPFALPPSWPRWAGVDYGFASPWCTLWFVQGDDAVYACREIYEERVNAPQQALRIRAMSEGESLAAVYCDPSMFHHRDDVTPSIADEYKALGLPVIPGSNDRLAGCAAVHQALSYGPDPLTGGVRDAPRLKVFSTCHNLIRTLPNLIRDDARPEDVDTRGEDHAYDALKYGLSGTSAALLRARKGGKRPGKTTRQWWEGVKA